MCCNKKESLILVQSGPERPTALCGTACERAKMTGALRRSGMKNGRICGLRSPMVSSANASRSMQKTLRAAQASLLSAVRDNDHRVDEGHCDWEKSQGFALSSHHSIAA
jgi:hypothetical protein